MGIDKSPTALRTIGEVAKSVGVKTHVLRFWESKFDQIEPQKRRGRRYYRQEDISIIEIIQELLHNQGYTIRGVQKFLALQGKDITLSSSVMGQSEGGVQEPYNKSESERDPFTSDLFEHFSSATDGSDNEPEDIVITEQVIHKFSDEQISRIEEIYLSLLDIKDKVNDKA